MSRKQTEGTRPRGDRVPLGVLFDETVALFHRLRLTAEEIHGQGEASAGRRGVLRSLGRGGAQTVPQLARARPVSRQHIQVLVNALLGDGLVELRENPAHRRSRLVALTRKGALLLAAMEEREGRLLSRLAVPASARELDAAAAVLRKVRESLEGASWA